MRTRCKVPRFSQVTTSERRCEKAASMSEADSPAERARIASRAPLAVVPGWPAAARRPPRRCPPGRHRAVAPRSAPRSPPDHRGSRPPVTLKCSPAATLPPEAGSRYPLPVRSSAGPGLCPAKIAGIRLFRPPGRGRSPFVRSVSLFLTRDPPFWRGSRRITDSPKPTESWSICSLTGRQRTSAHAEMSALSLRILSCWSECHLRSQ